MTESWPQGKHSTDRHVLFHENPRWVESLLLCDTNCFITGLMAGFTKQNLMNALSPQAARNSPCSKTAWAPCGKDGAVGVSSSSQLVCGSDHPSQGFAGPFFSLWRPLPALCHAPWRPWDLGDTHIDERPIRSPKI